VDLSAFTITEEEEDEHTTPKLNKRALEIPKIEIALVESDSDSLGEPESYSGETDIDREVDYESKHWNREWKKGRKYEVDVNILCSTHLLYQLK